MRDNRVYLKKAWMAMLGRCAREHNPSKVCDSWLNFDEFFRWANTRYFPGAHLDKDILGKGQRLYSPETAAFVTSDLNMWFGDGRNLRARRWKVCRVEGFKRYRVKFFCYCYKHPVDLGIYLTEKSATKAVQDYNREVLDYFAATEPDFRIVETLSSYKFR